MSLRAALLLAGAAAQPALADRLPMDRPITIDGITTVCTGIGEEAQNDPRWKAYPIRVEFSNGEAQYLAGAHVELAEGGKTLVVARLLGRLGVVPAGARQLHGPCHAALSPRRSEAAQRQRSRRPPSGQKRVVLQFSGVGPNE